MKPGLISRLYKLVERCKKEKKTFCQSEFKMWNILIELHKIKMATEMKYN